MLQKVGTELPKYRHLDTAYFSTVIAAWLRAEKGRGMGLAVKAEIGKKAGKDGIIIECVSARLLKARVLMKSNFVTFVLAYAPTEEAPDGQKAKHMAALNCTVASVPAREYVIILTDANASTGKKGEGGGEADSKVVRTYGRDKLNENGILLLGSAKDNQLVLLKTFFCTSKSGVSYTFGSANRSKRQARLSYILTTQADRRFIRCVNVRRPPLEAPELDHNVRKSPHPTQVRIKPEDTPKMADHRRLMIDLNL